MPQLYFYNTWESMLNLPGAFSLSIAMPFLVHWCIDYCMRPWFLRKNSCRNHEFMTHTYTFLLNLFTILLSSSHRSLMIYRKTGNTSKKQWRVIIEHYRDKMGQSMSRGMRQTGETTALTNQVIISPEPYVFLRCSQFSCISLENGEKMIIKW